MSTKIDPIACDEEQARRLPRGGDRVTSREGSARVPSPQGVTEGRPITAGEQMPRRLGFFEAEQLVKDQIGIVYIAPPRPTSAENRQIWQAENCRLWKQYEEKMQLVNALCMTMAEVYTMADGRLIRVDGEEIEAETVKAIFRRLTGAHLDKVISAIRMERDPERKKAKLNRRYFRAALYNAVFELEAQAQAGMDRPTDGLQ